MNLLALMTNRGFTPKRCSSADGGEYCSPCPVCGDGGKGGKSDRFHIWPHKTVDGFGSGRFWCRQCGASGDNIAFLQLVDGLQFMPACEELGIILPNKTAYNSKRYTRPPVTRQEAGEWRPRIYAEPCRQWQEKAAALLADCQARLANEPAAIAWLEDRGLTRQMIDKFGLGYNQSTKGGDRYRSRKSWGLSDEMKNGKKKKLWIPRGWVIPSYNAVGDLIQLRIRRLDEDIARFASNIKYLPLDGSSAATMVINQSAEVFVNVESGFDALLLAGLMGDKIGVITSWNNAARPDVRTDKLLTRSSCILGGLDYDQGGDSQQEWWQNQYKQYRRLPAFSSGAKDPGDAYKAGADLRAWLLAGMPKGIKIKLGFINQAPAKQPSSNIEKQKPAPLPEPDQDKVIEVELKSGKIIYVTDQQNVWHEYMAEEKTIFSHNELDRLQQATSTMNEDERQAAVTKAIEIKEMFSGYIRRGESIESCPYPRVENV